MPVLRRLHLEIRGAVQGVGFRPFVHRLAHELALAGWVRNDPRGVVLEVEGEAPALDAFLARLTAEKPAPAVLQEIAPTWLPAAGLVGFQIAASARAAAKSAVVLPDLATCPACRAELFAASDRRAGYPFTNCTHCGPRFTILLDLPYDRPQTTMRGFAMCGACRAEYAAPTDRRFHAQPNACPACGPALAATDREGRVLAAGAAALARTATALADGAIVAGKGLGGYQLWVDARNDAAVDRLRQRKRRPVKPLAVMVRDLTMAAALADLSAAETALLDSPQAPIVLLRRRPDAALARAIAPGSPLVGLLLPTTPLHHLLLAALGFPLVATSGNLTDEPIATDDAEARDRLGGVADLFLAHDRPIARHVDDSVAWIADGAPQPLRRARGYAPLPVLLARPTPTLLAVGAHQKNVIALAVADQVFLSQHIGDMETPQAHAAFVRVLADFVRLYEARPVALVHDLHPDYPSTRWALAAAADLDAALAQGGRRSGAAADAAAAGAESAPSARAIASSGRTAAAAPGAARAAAAPAAAIAAAAATSAAASAAPPPPLPTIAVQHHHAHLAACLAEHRRDGPALGFTWDGTGYGADGTVWGGEALLGDALVFRRVARLRPFRLPGGEAAVREPRRVALALWEQLAVAGAAGPDPAVLGDFTERERALLTRLVRDGLRSPWTSSVGRLFDGVAALVGLGARASFEGEAAMALEACADTAEIGSYPLPVEEAVSVAPPPGPSPGAVPPPVPEASRSSASAAGAPPFEPNARRAASARDFAAPRPGSAVGRAPLAPGEEPAPALLELDWRPLVAALLADLARGEPAGRIAARFHTAMADAALAVARAVGAPLVALSGGCFQNRLLTARLAGRLRGAGFEVLVHRQVPPNDGGLALGQVAVAAARLAAGA